MKQFKAYLFDFDGTLFDTLESLYEVYDIGLAAVNQTCTHEEAAAYIHFSLSELGHRRGLDEEGCAKLIAAVDEAIDDPRSMSKIKIFSDVKETLTALQEKDCLIAIVSGNSVHHIQNVLKLFQMEEDFAFIVGADPSRKPKPSGDPIIAARGLLPGLTAEDICYVGDSLQDPQTAINGGVAGILLERNGEYPDYQGLKIQSLKELLS
jgi:pyrophosphatase PpaX